MQWVAGYDHRGTKGGGQHGDELHLHVRQRDAAVSLSLFTWARGGLENQTGSNCAIGPGWLHLHFGFMWDAEQVREASPPTTCDVLETGKCWSPEGSPGLARDIWEAGSHGFGVTTNVALPGVECVVLDCVPEVWAALEAYMHKQREQRWKEHLALPRQCDKCCGTGLLPR